MLNRQIIVGGILGSALGLCFSAIDVENPSVTLAIAAIFIIMIINLLIPNK